MDHTQYYTAQYYTHNAILHSTTHTMLHCIVLHTHSTTHTVLHTQYYTAQYYTHNATLHSTTHTMLHCTVLHTVLVGSTSLIMLILTLSYLALRTNNIFYLLTFCEFVKASEQRDAATRLSSL